MDFTRSTARTRLVVLALALVLPATLVACSSDSSEGSGDEGTTTSAGPAPVIDDARLDQVWVADDIEGPITGGKYDIPYLAMPAGWEDDYGYTEQEYFLSGDAVSYGSADELTVDGKWDVQGTSATQPYNTRIVVRRPVDAEDFNGTVVVEWLNVTAGRDSDPEFGFLAHELMRNGYAYVGVSAQSTGIEPGGLGIEIPNVPKEALAPLKEWDPERYSSLSHPGDQYSYDIFSQAARTVLETGENTPLGSLPVERVMAVGESQSATRLATYINGIQPVTEMFDGFLVHGRGSGASGLNDGEGQTPPDGTQIRDDIAVPVLQFETETDLEFLKFVNARQDDHDHLVTWELAGAAHVDSSALEYGISAGRRWTDVDVDLSTSCGRGNEGPQTPVAQKAFASLHSWIFEGTRPAASPRIQTDDAGVIVRDDDGIAIGGIRTPDVDAPIATMTGKNESDNIICVLFGSTTPFTEAQLAERYADHDAYVAAVTESAEQAVADGFLLQNGADQMIAEAEEADIP